MRCPWPAHFPPVWVQTFWGIDPQRTTVGLNNQPGYGAAKSARDHKAAISIIKDVYQDHVLDAIVDSLSGEKTYVVAPSCTAEETNNVLAISYAGWLARQLDLNVCETIFQGADIKRDKRGGWARIKFQPEFYGDVPSGCDFIIADDVFTLGGTMAALRGFIENQGSRVICMTALAHSSGDHVEISLARQTRMMLGSKYGNELNELLKEEVGYGSDCLTEPEANLILGCADVQRVREALAREGYP